MSYLQGELRGLVDMKVGLFNHKDPAVAHKRRKLERLCSILASPVIAFAAKYGIATRCRAGHGNLDGGKDSATPLVENTPGLRMSFACQSIGYCI